MKILTLILNQTLRKLRPDLQVLGGQLPLDPRKVTSFYFIDDQGRLRLHPEIQPLFRNFVRPAGLSGEDLLEVDCPIALSLSSIQRVALLPDWLTHAPFASPDHHFLSQQAFEEILLAVYQEIFSFFNHLMSAGKQVVGVMCPGMRNNSDRRGEVYLATRAFYLAELSNMGVPIIDLTDTTCDANGVLATEYWVANAQDHVHANDKWGEHAANACLRHFQL